MDYDIIGDVHGQDGKLTALLAKLGYRIKDGAYRHPEGRIALFLGDLIDRGPGQLEVIGIVRNMIEAGSGRTIMGNHEWNAIGFGSRRPDGADYLRPRTKNKRYQHKAFLAQVGEDSALHKELVEWFKTLPPILDLGDIRLCHAWWNPEMTRLVASNVQPDGSLNESFLMASFDKSNEAFLAMEGITKGMEIRLPDGASFSDHSGIERKEVRMRWWDENSDTFRKAALVPEEGRSRIPDLGIPASVRLGNKSNVPVFLGHYWLNGKPGIQNANTAVLDYGAALKGPLVAYRWQGEPVLTDENLVWVSPGGQYEQIPR
jgi:hypothetical protein